MGTMTYFVLYASDIFFERRGSLGCSSKGLSARGTHARAHCLETFRENFCLKKHSPISGVFF